jgi:uncharacterized integral membrane protein
MQWLMLLPLLLFLVLFGVSNRQEVALTLWPFDLAWVTPLAVSVLLFSAVFFLLGAAIAWTTGLKHRGRARQLEQAVRVLEAEVSDHRAAQAKDLGAVPPPPGAGLALMRR